MLKNIGIQQNTNIQTKGPQAPSANISNLNGQNPEVFKGILDTEITKNAVPPTATKTEELLKFSAHALDRIQNRGIKMMKEDVQKLNEAVEKASKKGSKEALVLMGENAFIVSVKNKTVITAVDKSALKENVFTNIDSTVFAD